MDVTEPGAGHGPECEKVSRVQSRIGATWSLPVIMLLRAQRFDELRRGIGTISQRRSTLTLRNRERDGLVTRTVTPAIPPRVDDALTELGHALAEPVRVPGTRAFRHPDHIDAAQLRREARDGARGVGREPRPRRQARRAGVRCRAVGQSGIARP